MATAEYRMIGRHPYEVSVGDKVILAEPGQFVNLNDKDKEANKSLIEDNILIVTKSEKKDKE